MSKKIPIGPKPVSKPLSISADSWVESRLGEPEVETPAPAPVTEPVAKTEEVTNRYNKTLETLTKSERMKRLTIDIPVSLHRAIKAQCAIDDTTIADEVRKFLIKKYGKS